MLRKGVFAASLSIINDDLTLNIESTIKHAENLIKGGLHGVFFFGSTGQSQLISLSEKKNLISKISTHKLRKNFFIGTGCNSINENLDLMKYCIEYGFDTFLVMPPAYYKNNSDEGVFKFYEILIENNLIDQSIFEIHSADPIHLNDIEPALSDTMYWEKGDVFLSVRYLSAIIHYRPSSNKVINYITGPFSLSLIHI